ncbi:hypothetical protein JCM10212_000416 [Sporobolomyces blumeae]
MADHEQLESHVDSFDPGLKLFVAIAAKVATLHALAGRYTQHLTLEDLSPPPSAPSTPQPSSSDPAEPSQRDVAAAQRELDAEQQRVRVLMKETVRDATEWLVLVCQHFDVDMATLPENPDPSLRFDNALDSDGTDVGSGQGGDHDQDKEKRNARDKKEFDIVWELCLVSLGLVGPAQGKTTNSQASSAAKSVSSRVGGFFSSSSSSSSSSEPSTKAGPSPPESSTETPPRLTYTSLHRSLVVCAAEVLGISDRVVASVERAVAQFLYFQLQAQEQGEIEKKVEDGTLEWDEVAREYRQKQQKKGNALKWAATGAGFVLGGVAIGLTGGLAAPALAPVLAGTFGIAAFSGAGGAVLIGTLLGLGGGGLAGYRTHRRMKGLEEVSFEPIKSKDAQELPQIPSLTATIVASGFLLDPKDSTEPWVSTYSDQQVDAYALKADPQTFLEAGKALESYLKNKLISMGGTEVIKRTALGAVYAGVALPLTVWQTTSMALDSDFTRCKEKAKKAGILLAEILEKSVQGKRPTILVGYGMGASLILSCLVELHRRQLGHLVYSATLISLPEAPSAVAWASARSVVSHELVNVYSTTDWVLAIAARLFTLSNKIAGLGPVPVEGIANVDVSDLVHGHLELRTKLAQILDRVNNHRNDTAVVGSSSSTDVKVDHVGGSESRSQQQKDDEIEGQVERGLDELTVDAKPPTIVEARSKAGAGDA